MPQYQVLGAAGRFRIQTERGAILSRHKSKEEAEARMRELMATEHQDNPTAIGRPMPAMPKRRNPMR